MPHDAQLDAVVDELDRLGKSRNDAWQVPRVEGELLRHIAIAMNAQTIVEVGTSYGFSGLFWASALRITGGRLHTIDKDPKKHESSRQTFTRAGVADVVTNYLGDAQAVMASMPETMQIDISFIDADKPATQAYFDLLWPRTRVGGCVLIDNAATHREQLRDFVVSIRSRDDAIGTEVAVGNGIEWVIKLR